jgi:hypothetical protein
LDGILTHKIGKIWGNNKVEDFDFLFVLQTKSASNHLKWQANWLEKCSKILAISSAANSLS